MPKPGNPPSPSPAGLPCPAAILAGPDPGPSAGYVVLASAAGRGFSLFSDTALTTWEGPGASGLRFFVRDLDSGVFWSPGRPTRAEDADVHSSWDLGTFTLDHREHGLQATLETCVLADHPAELRRLTLTNLTGSVRRLDVTSLADVVLNQTDAHAAHPAFSKLFLQTLYDEERRALLVRRRPREPQEHHPLLVHAILEQGDIEFETDRARFYGRGYPADRPAALRSRDPLSRTTGNVLDPVVSLRRELVLAAGQSTTFSFLLGAASDDQAARAMLDSLDQGTAAGKAFAVSRSAAESQLKRLGITPADHVQAQQLAAAILRGKPGLRAQPVEPDPDFGQPCDLTRLGIQPRRPLVVVVADAATTERMRLMFRVWQDLNIHIQLVIINDDKGTQNNDLGLVGLRPDQLSAARHEWLLFSAALVVTGPMPDLAAPFSGEATAPNPVPDIPPAVAPAGREDLQFGNGWGGFTPDGNEYIINVPSEPGGGLRVPPRPWTNVLANDKLGCIISETGAGATWCGNSRENRLTPWFNDPLLDPHGDAIFLRDEITGTFFSCLPGPAPVGGNYEMRHGFGYSRCRRDGHDLAVETLVFVDRVQPVRMSRVRLTNEGESSRRLSLFAYSQLVLGGLPSDSGRFVRTSIDSRTNVMTAVNPTAGPFAKHAAFASVLGDDHVTALYFSGDRTKFLGSDGDLAHPAALAATSLDGRAGSGLDPCFAIQATLDLAPGETAEAWILLGQAPDTDLAVKTVATLARPGACEAAWHDTRDYWREGLGGIRVTTPSASLDIMVNGWLGYQTLACRINGRTALYQSGGAFGFRDQLQDAMSLLPLWPELARQQILLNAAHQFREGDVLHWWHPPLDRGIRTRFADDLLWLPLATVEYMNVTGDRRILEEVAPYLDAPALEQGQDEVFLQPVPAGESADLYDHCCRAIDRSLTRGSHGLPLFGTGDWNDGMNRVGREGRGESVWMGFFLVTIIDGFLPLCDARADHERGARYRKYRDEMVLTLNDTGWDGRWYRRGYFDDGSPLGSSQNKECAIDALAQSWSVLSGVAEPARANRAMDAVEEHLINENEGLIRLLTPPFVDTSHDPGYIKGYVSGVRENGGQYTHAALWVVRAMAVLGRRDRAAVLLDMLNPINHSATPEQVDRYQVEPYVVAADIYGTPPHVGRGGWTWYTGSSGWMMRVALESVLGLRTEGDTLVMAPCVPDEWPAYSIVWRVPAADGSPSGAGTIFEIQVNNPDLCSESVIAVTCDGDPCPPVNGLARIPLRRDGRTHRITLTLGKHPEDRS